MFPLIFRNNVVHGKEKHDKLFKSMIDHWYSFKRTNENPALTNEMPYFPNKIPGKYQKIRAEQFNIMNSSHDNLIPNGKNWDNHGIPRKIDIMLRRRSQQLCKGIVSTASFKFSNFQLLFQTITC